MSDINLKNLGKGESGAPPPNTKKIVKREGRGRPNRGRHKTRISARRIGGQNYAQDVAALKRAREQQAKKNKTNPQSTGVMKPVNMSLRNTPKKNVQSSNGTLPRVQELGGIKGARRSSSRMRLGSGRVSHQRSRKSSSTSNHSGVQNESVTGSVGRGETIIRYGELKKKGVVTTKWKKRFFVLTDAHLFYYLETFDVPQELHQIELEPKGKIDLGLVDEVTQDKNNTGVFQLYTPTRTYRLKLEGEGDVARYGVSAWVASIRGACENTKQQHLNGAVSKGPRSSFSYKVDEMDQAAINANQYKHPAKRLIDADSMYNKNRKGPHQPASLDEYEDWTPFDVSAWLYTVHLQKYSEDFYQQQIDGKALKKVNTGEDAAKLGVEEEDIMKFMAGVQTLKDMNLISDLPLN